MQNVRCVHAVQNHVHDTDDVGKTLFLLSVEGFLLQSFPVGNALDFLLHVGVGFAKEPGTSASRVEHGLANFRVDDADDGADKRTRRVVFAAVTACVAHPADFVFVQVAHLVLVFAALETQRVGIPQDFTKVVAARYFVAEFTEDFANLVLQRLRRGGGFLKLFEVREQLVVHEVREVVAGERLGVVRFAILGLRGGPGVPTEHLFDNPFVGFALEFGFFFALGFEVVQVLEEQDPRGLLHVIQFVAASTLFPEDVVDIVKSLLKHKGLIC